MSATIPDPFAAPLSRRLLVMASVLRINGQARLASDAEAMAAEARDMEARPVPVVEIANNVVAFPRRER